MGSARSWPATAVSGSMAPKPSRWRRLGAAIAVLVLGAGAGAGVGLALLAGQSPAAGLASSATQSPRQHAALALSRLLAQSGTDRASVNQAVSAV